MRLNNKKVIMRAKEGKPNPEKAIDLFRMVYFAILIGLGLYIIYYFVTKSIMIKGEGFVSFDIKNIEAPYTGIVKDLNITKNIKKGQFLCNIQERFRNPLTASSTVIKPNLNLSNLKIKIDSLKAQYSAKKEQLRLLNKEYHRLEAYHGLGLENPNSTYIRNLQNTILQVKVQLAVLKVQIKDYENVYRNYPKEIKTISKEIPPFTYVNHSIYSPVNGSFIEGVEENNTPIKATNLLFKIQTYQNLKILGYFSQKYIHDLAVGDKVKIVIGDDYEYYGIIRNISVSFTDVNFKTLQKLQVIIEPIEGNISFWRKCNLLRVKLRKYKW